MEYLVIVLVGLLMIAAGILGEVSER